MKKWQKIWIAAGLLALLLRHFAAQYPEFTERYYSRGLFPVLRRIWDFTAGWLPFAWLYVFLFLSAFILLRAIYGAWKAKHRPVTYLKSFLFAFLSFVGMLVFLFLFLWGFNYFRVPFENQLGLQPQPLTAAALEDEMLWSTTALIHARASVPIPTEKPVADDALPPNLESHLRGLVSSWLSDRGFPTPGRVRGRMIYPRGILMVFSTAGIYFPFTGEGHIDGGLHHLQWPPVMAHELSHGFGFGDEGVCNFIAFAACADAPDPVVKYTAYLSYWRTVAAQFRRHQPEKYLEIRAGLPAGIQADLEGIRQNMLAYPDILPQFRDAAYNSYLKAQGVKEGMMSYDRVTMLVRASRKE